MICFRASQKTKDPERREPIRNNKRFLFKLETVETMRFDREKFVNAQLKKLPDGKIVEPSRREVPGKQRGEPVDP